MLSALLDVVLPVFLVASVGYLYAGWRRFPIREITDLTIHLTAGCLIFDALSRAERFAVDAAMVPVAAGLVVLGTVGLALAARAVLPPLRSLSLGAVVLPVTFMNAGNLGLPLVKLAFGSAGFELAMLFFVSYMGLQYSLGIWLVKGRGGLQEFLRLPLLYAAVLGILVNQLEWTVPRVIAAPVGLLGETVIPLMLMSLGARIRTLMSGQKRASVSAILIVAGLRMGGGFTVGWLVVAGLGFEGLMAQVTLLTAMLPPAVMNFALVEEYADDEYDAAAVSGAIAAGTLVAVPVLPLAIGWL